jgi:hypothetical protein
MQDAFETANSIISDVKLNICLNNQKHDKKDLVDWIEKKQGFRTTSFKDWKLVEAEEKKRGLILGKSAEKLVNLEEILDIINNNKK